MNPDDLDAMDENVPFTKTTDVTASDLASSDGSQSETQGFRVENVIMEEEEIDEFEFVSQALTDWGEFKAVVVDPRDGEHQDGNFEEPFLDSKVEDISVNHSSVTITVESDPYNDDDSISTAQTGTESADPG